MIIAHILVHEPSGRQGLCGGYGLCRWCTEGVHPRGKVPVMTRTDTDTCRGL